MKLLLLSDSHGRTDRVLSETERHKDIVCVVHLGDYARGPTYSILELTPSGVHADIFSY